MTRAHRYMQPGQIYRYPRPPQSASEYVDAYPNLNYLSVSDDGRRVSLEKGINPVALVRAVDGDRCPAIAIRSSPWKAGQESNPWHDVFDLENSRIRYYGDNRPGLVGDPGLVPGNAALQRWWALYNQESQFSRVNAPPLLVFRSVTIGGKVKGYVEFCGLAVLESCGKATQFDMKTGLSFVNYVFDLAVLDLKAEQGLFNWEWIDRRRDKSASSLETLELAPQSWRLWVEAADGDN